MKHKGIQLTCRNPGAALASRQYHARFPDVRLPGEFIDLTGPRAWLQNQIAWYTSGEYAQLDATDPEFRLRTLWTNKDVPQARQAALIADITAKAAPGAMVGPFRIGG